MTLLSFARLIDMRLLMLVLLCVHGSALAQGLFSEGRDFYLGHIPPSHPSVLSGPALAEVNVYALVSSYTDNEIFVSYPDPVSGKDGPPVKYTVKAFRTVEVLLDQTKLRPTGPGDIGEYRSVHITSKDPVTIHYYSMGPCAGGGYLALPTLMWGKEYVVATEQDNPGVGAWVSPPAIADAEPSNGCFLIIAAEDNTRVTIIPNARTGGGHTGATQGQGATGKPQPYQVTLHRGQTYFVRSTSAYVGDYDDMSGSIVKSDKPVAVIMGHENANVGDGIVKETSQSDARDFMIEQAIPWEYASNAGYMSVPMDDAPGVLEGGQGEDVKAFVSETQRTATINTSTCSGPSSPLTPGLFTSVAKTNLATPMYYYADSGTKFQLVQYELRSDGDGAPYTAPAMMNVVPFQCARNGYLWYIPKKVGFNGETLYQEYYVTIISKYSVRIAADGADLSDSPTIDEVLKPGKQWVCFNNVAPTEFGPYGGILRAKTYKFNPGVTYFVRSADAFLAYVYGYVASRNEQNNLNISSFAFPAGMRVYKKETPSIKSDLKSTSCSSWELCITDTIGVGIKSVSLVNDPLDKYYYREETHPYHQTESYNYLLAGGRSPNGISAEYVVPVSKACVTLSIADTTKSASGVVEVTDARGRRGFQRFTYYSQDISFDRSNERPAVSVGNEQINTYIFKTKSSFQVNEITSSDPHFTISTAGIIPFTVRPNDPLIVDVVYVPTDTFARSTHITIRNECNSYDTIISATGVTGLIYAGDLNFGTVSSLSCREVLIENRGKDTFQLLGGYILGSLAFKFDAASTDLPKVLPPGRSTKITVCYTPDDAMSDSGHIEWITDIRSPYERSIKTVSSLKGRLPDAGVRSAAEHIIKVFPNPAKNTLYVDLSSLNGQGQLSLFNSGGVTCFSKEVAPGQIQELEITNLPSGQYTVMVKVKDSTYTASILIW